VAEQEYLIINHLSLSEIARFFSKVKVNKTIGCWEWVAGKANGYGHFWYKGKYISSHRFTYAWLIAPVPMGHSKEIPTMDHVVCDNPPCCNPAHLKLGPQKDNVLRGNSRQALNARKTHCKNGHPFGPTRHFRKARPVRICTICAAEYQQKRRDAKRKTPYRPRPSIKGNQHARRPLTELPKTPRLTCGPDR
jgi:hypothetical protein